MTIARPFESVPNRMRKSVLAVLIATVVLTTVAIFFGAKRYFELLETNNAQSQMALYLRSLNETLGQHQHLPFVLANDPRYLNTLLERDVDPETSDRLTQVSHEAKLEAIYLMDVHGVVVATSNAGQANSFLGQNYSFRPYFKEALAGQRSDYFAIGATSGRPGYFVAEPISFDAGQALGVMAIKLDISELQKSWESENDTVVAINEDGIIVLASDPSWLYRPIERLLPQTKDAILASRQFGNEMLTQLDWVQRGETNALVENVRYLTAVGQADWRGWSVIYLRPEASVMGQTLLTTGLFGSAIALLLGFATFLRSRRIELAYAASENQRRALIETNSQLQKAQTELARSAKLSALGQLAASVTHELGQPISAFRNHLVAAEIGGEITSPQTAKNLNKLVDRMEAITKQFRYFARGRVAAKTRTDLHDVITEAIGLVLPDISVSHIDLRYDPIDQKIVLNANKVLIEQAFANLLRNAVHAVEDAQVPEIHVDVDFDDAQVTIRVSDNGPGLGDARLQDLQEPFFSTKPSGVGMGLGLAIATEIIKEHNGTLTLGNTNQGAQFVVTLPILSNGDAS